MNVFASRIKSTSIVGMKRTIGSDMMVKEESEGFTAYYHSKYIFSKLKRRIENEESNDKIKIQEPIKVELEVVDLEVVK